MGNMSKEQMQTNLNMLNPEMMKNASNMFANMSDSQIQMQMAQMGMPNMDPSFFRQMCKNMSQMDDSQLNNMKNMAQSNFNMNNNNNYNNNNYTTITNNSNTNSSTNNKTEGTIVGQVTKIKEQGNILFKQDKYDDAIKKYYEAIEEIKTSTDKDKYKNELSELEKQCRLNIANCKLKTKDYEGVINECSIVLENNKCFKAYYRMGLALFYKKKYDKAFRYLDNANAIGTPSEKSAVEPHLKECKEKLEEIKKKEREERKRKEKEKEEKNIINENNKIKEEKKEIKKEKIEKNENNNNKNEINTEEKKKEEEKKDSKLDNLRDMIEKEKEKNKKDKEEKKDEIDDDIKVEDTKDSSYSNNINNNYNNFNNFNNNINFNNNPPKYSQEYINQARNQLNNMNDDQINAMIGNMKQMDNQTLKNLMAAQGMNLSDQQIEMMKASLSPELIKMAQHQNFPNPMANTNINNINNNNNSINNKNNNTNINNNVQPPQMPNLNNMDFSQMMDFVKKNPELLKMVSPQLSQMMGGKNVDPEIMMKSMENILWIFSLPGRIKRFMLSWRGICFIILIIAIFYGIFKRK